MLLPYGDFWLNGWGAAAPLTGSAALTWDAWIGSGTGAVTLTGAAAGPLDPWTGTGTGVLPLSGTADLTLGAWTGSGAAQIPITATGVSGWAAWTATGSGLSSPTIPQHPGRVRVGELVPRDGALVGSVAAQTRTGLSTPYPKYPASEEEPW